jgi:hypothetical protein
VDFIPKGIYKATGLAMKIDGIFNRHGNSSVVILLIYGYSKKVMQRM